MNGKVRATAAWLAITAGGPSWAQLVYRSQHFSVYRDRVVEGRYTARALPAGGIESDYPIEGRTGKAVWRPAADVSRYPVLASAPRLVNALYRLSLDEMVNDIRADGTFMAGEKWDGVWTRDISYSILLALALIEPDVSRRSLLKKVRNGRIVQDTGTGGSWPVSSDRMSWALAAWEVYLTTGDRDWLRQSYDIIRASAEDDAHAVVSPDGLVLGETTFLDWREQTYPRWMQPVDIYSSAALGNNAVHYRAYRILARMAALLGDRGRDWDARADRIALALNERFWLEDRGYYGEYLYGRIYRSLSPRSESLGESLAMLFGIAAPERQDRILRSAPVMEYGIPCVYPASPGIPPYHNRAVWPFVQAFWNLSAAARGNGAAVEAGLAAVWRAAALFETNKENFVASTGAPGGTAINSNRQLWSVAANLAMVYRILFGIEPSETGLRFHPVVPKTWKGTWTLDGLAYRKAVLRIRVTGFGRRVKRMRMDGKSFDGEIPAGVEGRHEVEIELAGDPLSEAGIHRVDEQTALETPQAHLANGRLNWNAVPGAAGYATYRNGERTGQTTQLSAETNPGRYTEYQVAAAGPAGGESFLSEPAASGGQVLVVEAETGAESSAEDLHGFNGDGFVEISRRRNRVLRLRARVDEAGHYSVSVRYSNGSGPVNTDNKCAIRTLMVDGKAAGPIVMPQRGDGQWSNWGMSSAVTVLLTAGEHEITLAFEPFDENMNGEVNRAMVDYLQLIKLDSL